MEIMISVILILAFMATVSFGQTTTTVSSSTSAASTLSASSSSAGSTSTLSCALQMDAYQLCKTRDIPRSVDGKIMKQKIDAIYEKCAGTMPKNCTTFWKTADECFTQEMDKSETDTQMSASKKQTMQAVDQCYERTPNDPFADLFEELYPEMVLFDEGNLKPQNGPGFGGRKFLPPPQCAPTPQNLECVSKEMASLALDDEAKKASTSLRRIKRQCDEKLSAECVPQSPPLWMCVDRALKQFMRQTEDAMQRCMQQKSFPVVFRPPPAGPASAAMLAGQQPQPPFATNGAAPMTPQRSSASFGSAGGLPLVGQAFQQQQQRAFNYWNYF